MNRVPLVEPAPADPSWPRYSSRPLPPYRFVPGLNPHPHRDPGGHSRTDPPSPPGPWSPAEWRRLEAYLYGVDLHNFAYWWEAHEAFEGLWLAAGRTSPHARFVQGLIHVSAACLNRHRGNRAAARRQARRGIERLARQEGRIFMGIEVDRFVSRVEALVAGREVPPPLIELLFGPSDEDPFRPG